MLVYLLEELGFPSTSSVLLALFCPLAIRAGNGLQEVTSSPPHFASGNGARKLLTPGSSPCAVSVLGEEKPFLFTAPAPPPLCPILPVFPWLMKILYNMSQSITLEHSCSISPASPSPKGLVIYVLPTLIF